MSRLRLTPFALPLWLFLFTAVIAYGSAYNRAAAGQTLGLIFLGAALYAGAVWWQRRAADRQRAARQVAWGLSLLGAAFALYFIAGYDWSAFPDKGVPVQGVGQAVQGILLAALPLTALDSFNSNVAGGVLAVLLPLAVALVIASRPWPLRLAALLPLAILLLGLLLTASRGAWLALAGAAALWLLWQTLLRLTRGKRPLASQLFFALMALFSLLAFGLLLAWSQTRPLLAQVWPGGQGRLDLYQDSINLLLTYPFIGGGLDSYLMLHTSYSFLLHVGFSFHAHNLYLDVAIAQGWPGLLALLWFWGTAVFLIRRAMQRGPVDLWLAAGTLALVVAALHGLVDDTLYGSRALPLLFLPPAFVAPLAEPLLLPRPAARPLWLRLLPLGGLLLISLFAWRGIASLAYTNWAAVQQSRSELALYDWPDWPLQDAVRREIDLTGALAGYEQALALWPENPMAHRRLGQILLSLGDYEAALGHLAAAYAIQPWDNATRQLYGEALIVNGQVEEGAALWQTVHNAQNQLLAREYWYDFIGDNGRLALIRAALP